MITYFTLFPNLKKTIENDLEDWVLKSADIDIIAISIIAITLLSSLYFYTGCVWLEEVYASNIIKGRRRWIEALIRWLVLIFVSVPYLFYSLNIYGLNVDIKLWNISVKLNFVVFVIALLGGPLLLYLIWHFVIRGAKLEHKESHTNIKGKCISNYFIATDIIMSVSSFLLMLGIFIANVKKSVAYISIFIGVVLMLILCITIISLLDKLPEEKIQECEEEENNNHN